MVEINGDQRIVVGAVTGHNIQGLNRVQINGMSLKDRDINRVSLKDWRHLDWMASQNTKGAKDHTIRSDVHLRAVIGHVVRAAAARGTSIGTHVVRFVCLIFVWSDADFAYVPSDLTSG